MVRVSKSDRDEAIARLQPLTPVRGEAANSLQIRCCNCPEAARYDRACADGWTYDPKGTPFVAYYCPTCQTIGGAQ
jgi:hypothetical protein